VSGQSKALVYHEKKLPSSPGSCKKGVDTMGCQNAQFAAFLFLLGSAFASPARATGEKVDVIFLIDPSGSVQTQWLLQVNGVRNYIQELPTDGTVAVAVLTFDAGVGRTRRAAKFH
jgi:hypothetical protein